MAGTTGLEPATSAVTGQRSNQLSYVPTNALSAIWISCHDRKVSTASGSILPDVFEPVWGQLEQHCAMTYTEKVRAMWADSSVG